MRIAVCVIVAAAAAFFVSSCGKRRPVAVVVPSIGATETGIASWYGNPYHGRRAANGEIYDMEKMTAAHRTFPFGTWVRVHDLDNGKSVDVRITDRGPFVDGRIVDLSRAAARAIDMIGPGLAKVRLEVISPPSPEVAQPVETGPALFSVQVGSFTQRDNAERLAREMEQRYGTARLVMRDADRPAWRVLVGEAGTIEDAQELAGRLRREGRDAFVVRLDE